MSHYLLAVLVPKDTQDIKAKISELMAPFNEATVDDGKWDWWRIGGRWDGRLLSDLESWKKETCLICAGQGLNAINHHYSDAHEQLDRNVVPVSQLPKDFHSYAILTPDGWSHRQLEDYSDLPDEKWLPIMHNALVGWPDSLVVAVDCHQ